jgi:F-type H+-transporting ATPase subunit a
MAVLVLLFVLGTRRMKLVPKGLQNLLEWGIETLLNLVQDSIGKDKGRKFFPVIATIFLFVFINAWMGLLPFFGSFGRNEVVDGQTVLVPILRPANTDLNLTLALAIASFVFVEYIGISQHGFFKYAKKFVNLGPLFHGFGKLFSGKVKSGLGAIFMGAIEAFVGFIEAISEGVRLLSFSFRLFGNMLAGEILLLIGFFLVPFVFPLAFYSLELLVGLIQAAVFAMLTMVFAAMAAAEHEH